MSRMITVKNKKKNLKKNLNYVQMKSQKVTKLLESK